MTFTRRVLAYLQGQFDVVFFENDAVASIGIAVRDSNGNSIATLSKRIRMPHTVCGACKGFGVQPCCFYCPRIKLFFRLCLRVTVYGSFRPSIAREQILDVWSYYRGSSLPTFQFI